MLLNFFLSHELDAKSFGMRLSELKKHKNLSIREISQSSGITKSKIESIIAGKRLPIESEIEGLACAFGISVERLKKTDTRSIVEEINSLVGKEIYPDYAMSLADQLLSLALDTYEVLDSYFYLGRIHYIKREWQESLDYRKKAFALAENELERSDERFIRACNELLMHHFHQEENDELRTLVDYIKDKDYFIGDLRRTGMITHYYGLTYAREGRVEEAKKQFLEAWNIYRLDKDSLRRMGRVEATLAHIAYYFDHDLEESQRFIEMSMKNLADDPERLYYIAVKKDYARLLLLRGEVDAAKQFIEATMAQMETEGLDFPNKKGKLLLLLGEITKDHTLWEAILDLQHISPDLKANVYHLLAVYYMQEKNSDKSIFYHTQTIDIISRRGKFDDYKRGEWF